MEKHRKTFKNLGKPEKPEKNCEKNLGKNT